jgi:methyl coenzyme M reductase subunit C
MELIPQISSAADPLPIVHQFVQYVVEHKPPVTEVFRRLLNALRSKKPHQRSNIGFCLWALLRRTKSEVDSHAIYELSKSILLQNSATADNRRSTIALLLAWNSMIRAGAFDKDSEDLQYMLRMCHGIGNDRPCYRSIAYATMWTIIEHVYKDTASFKTGIFTELIQDLGSVLAPAHGDSFLLWLKINRRFPGLELKRWASTPTSAATMRALSIVFENSVKDLPEIPPFWYYLAEIDAMQLVHNAMELWSQKQPPLAFIPLMASVAAFSSVDVQNFISLMQRHHKYYHLMSLSHYSELLTNSILAAAESFMEKHKHRGVSLIASVTKCVRSKNCGKLIARLDDASTRDLINNFMNDHGFEECLEVLWAQTRRESLEDESIVTRLFEMVVAKIGGDEDRQRLIPFLSACADRITPSGRHWFCLFEKDVPEVTHLILRESSDVVGRVASVLAATKVVHAIVGLEGCEFPDSIKSFEDVVSTACKMIASKCDVCRAVGRSLARWAMEFGESLDLIQVFSSDILILIKCLSIPSVSGKAITLLLKRVESIPRTIASRPGSLIVNISEEDAEKVIEDVFRVMKSGVVKPFIEVLASVLISKISIEKCCGLATTLIKEQFRDMGISKVDLMPLLLKRGKEVADHVMNIILEKVGQQKTQGVLRRARVWLQAVCERYTFDREQIGKAVGIMTEMQFGDSRGDRKRAEDAFGWAVSFIASQKMDIPLDSLQETLKQFEKSQSRTLQALASRLKINV